MVMKWGARLVYEQDIEDLKQNILGSSSCNITPFEDNLDDSVKDTKTRQSCDDFDGDGVGPSGEGTFNEVDTTKVDWEFMQPRIRVTLIVRKRNPSDNGSIELMTLQG